MLLLYFVYPILISTKYVIIFNTIRTIFPLYIVKRHIYIYQLKLIFILHLDIIGQLKILLNTKHCLSEYCQSYPWTIRPYESAKEHYEYIDC